MTDKPRKVRRPDGSGQHRQGNPEDWKTGDEPMTRVQRSYLYTLAAEAGEKVDDELTKAAAAQRIEELQRKRVAGGARVSGDNAEQAGQAGSPLETRCDTRVAAAHIAYSGRRAVVSRA